MTAAAALAQQQLEAAGTTALRRHLHPIEGGLGEELERVVEVLVARSELLEVLVVELHPQRGCAGKAVLERQHAVLGQLCRVELVDAVLDLELVEPLRLVKPTPCGPHDRSRCDRIDQVDPRTDLVVVDPMLAVPSQP